MWNWIFDVGGIGIAIIVGVTGLGMIAGRILHDMNPSDPLEGHPSVEDELERARLERAARFARRLKEDRHG